MTTKTVAKKPVAMPKAKTVFKPVVKSAAKKTVVAKAASSDLAALEKLSERRASTRHNKAKETNLQMREHLWPDLAKERLWLREDKTRKGFTTMPRTMPMIINLINDISKRVTNGRAVPAGKSYLVLWCRVFDEGFLKIENESAAALEAGYAGERNVTTWREHMTVLKALGFIDSKEGLSGEFHYILIFNPYQVIKALHAKGWIQQVSYTALFERAMEIRATDLTEK
jgi:hypothetical protein